MAKAKNTYIYGYHTVQTALERVPQLLSVLFLQTGRQDSRVKAVSQMAQNLGVALQQADKSVLDRLAQGGVHQGFVLQAKPLPLLDESLLLDNARDKLEQEREERPFYLILEGVSDPHNFGACLRTCAAVGAAGVIVARHDRASLNSTVLKVSSGGAFVTPVYEVANIVRTLKQLQSLGYWAIGTALTETAQSLFDLSLIEPLVWVMGSEGRGLKRLTLEACDYCAKIPMSDAVGSLNVSVALGVAMFEAQRQRMQCKAVG